MSEAFVRNIEQFVDAGLDVIRDAPLVVIDAH